MISMSPSTNDPVGALHVNQDGSEGWAQPLNVKLTIQGVESIAYIDKEHTFIIILFKCRPLKACLSAV